MTPTGENIARCDTGGCGQAQWDTPKPSRSTPFLLGMMAGAALLFALIN